MNIIGKKKNGQTFSISDVAELSVYSPHRALLFSAKNNEAEDTTGQVCEPCFYKIIGFDEKDLKERYRDKEERLLEGEEGENDSM